MDVISDFKKEINALLDEGNYVLAKENLFLTWKNINKHDESYFHFLAEIAGFFIDIGSETYDKEAAEIGIDILKKNETDFNNIHSVQSFNYCLANGIYALYKIKNKERKLPTLETVKSDLIESKNYYFKAYKEIDLFNINTLDLQILTNLGNNLSDTGRVIEAIRLYKTVLKANPNFPQALLGLSQKIEYWAEISFCSQSISLIVAGYDSYRKVKDEINLSSNQKRYIKEKLRKYEEYLNKIGFDINSIDNELFKSEAEYRNHSDFRKFCIDNDLILNEHSLYCKCLYLTKDNLSTTDLGITSMVKK